MARLFWNSVFKAAFIFHTHLYKGVHLLVIVFLGILNVHFLLVKYDRVLSRCLERDGVGVRVPAWHGLHCLLDAQQGNLELLRKAELTVKYFKILDKKYLLFTAPCSRAPAPPPPRRLGLPSSPPEVPASSECLGQALCVIYNINHTHLLIRTSVMVSLFSTCHTLSSGGRVCGRRPPPPGHCRHCTPAGHTPS